MQRISVAVILVLAGAGLVSAEEFQKWSAGLTAAATINEATSSYSQNINPVLATNSGVFDSMWIGGIVHVTPTIVIRPAVMFFRSSGKDEDVQGATTDFEYTETAYGASADLLYFLPASQNLSLYAGPAVKWTTWSGEVNDIGAPADFEYTRSSIAAAAVVGAQFMLSSRFGFFGDLRLGLLKVTETEVETDPSAGNAVQNDFENTFTQTSTQGAQLGAVLYLR